MLLKMRDTLYESNWDDFVFDLRARAEGRPHVFVTVPCSPEMKSVILRHLGLIDQMRRWEDQNGCLLRA